MTGNALPYVIRIKCKECKNTMGLQGNKKRFDEVKEALGEIVFNLWVKEHALCVKCGGYSFGI